MANGVRSAGVPDTRVKSASGIAIGQIIDGIASVRAHVRTVLFLQYGYVEGHRGGFPPYELIFIWVKKRSKWPTMKIAHHGVNALVQIKFPKIIGVDYPQHF